MKLIVGLGNPEEKYFGTRHNLGFEVVEKLVNSLQRTGDSWENNDRFKAEICKLKTENCDLIIIKPQTYMNNSGMAVSAVMNYYKINPEDVIIVYDELDLPLGKIKVRIGGAGAGHHGVESVITLLGTDRFIRVRLGIGNLKTQSGEHKAQHINAEKFVLEPFMHGERHQVKHMIKQTMLAIELLLEKGLDEAQKQFN